MKRTLSLLIVLQGCASVVLAADLPPGFVEAGLKRRREIQLGGDFSPESQVASLCGGWPWRTNLAFV